MDIFINTIPIVAGIWMLGTVFRISTYTFMAMLGWKLIPSALSASSIFVGLKLWGIL